MRTETPLPYLGWLKWVAGREFFGESDAKRELNLSDAEFNSMFQGQTAIIRQIEWPGDDKSRSGRCWCMTIEGYFHLLEYEELHEARESAERATHEANEAHNLATKALWISATLAAMSIVIALATTAAQFCTASDVRVVQMPGSPAAIEVLTAPK
jgi:hypothetical protein